MPHKVAPVHMTDPAQTVELEEFAFFQTTENEYHRPSLNLFNFLQIRNFWKRRLCSRQELTCWNDFIGMGTPSMWTEKLEAGFKPL